MIIEPLFRDNILSNIYNSFVFFFKFNDMYTYAGVIAGALLIFWAMTLVCSPREYEAFVPQENFRFKKSPADFAALGCLLLSVAVYACGMFSLEQSIFYGFDSMTIDFIDSMKEGMKSVFGEWRFTPLGGIDYNLILGISNNYLIINIYILLKQLLCIFLLYKFLSFVPVAKRLVAITLINLVPAVFVVNNVIYLEQSIIIFVLLSLMSAEKYRKSGKGVFLLLFMIFMNLAIYSKETVIIFYAGLGAYLLLEAVIDGKITLNSFFSPLKTIKNFPVEWIMFWSMFIYATAWLLAAPVEENRYLVTHAYPLLQVMAAHWVELAINGLALVIAVYKTVAERGKNLCCFCEGGLFGASAITVFMVFYLQTGSFSDFMLSYYVYIPAIVSVAYIFYALSQKSILSVFAIALLCGSSVQNYKILIAQQGAYRRDIAEYIVNMAKDEETFIYLYCKKSIDEKFWKTMAWSSALKYASPNAKIVLKTDLDIYKFYQREEDKFFEKRLAAPVSGDYILVNRTDNSQPPLRKDIELVYQNKVYALYKLKE